MLFTLNFLDTGKFSPTVHNKILNFFISVFLILIEELEKFTKNLEENLKLFYTKNVMVAEVNSFRLTVY